ncbi:hypothetical protein OIU77_013289 [Salix suchowensis]|uniref:Uncharacterized protein n=1 Tax=Salix suchowensis TaxID=1278906 RepID=A0ABQ8ZTZ8_9ROSI|nr:hypothetical protein OIU77_013289 [Salix suchowensis]
MLRQILLAGRENSIVAYVAKEVCGRETTEESFTGLKRSLQVPKKNDEYHRKLYSPLPENVEAGRFAVISFENGKPERFVVPLSYLNHPRFLVFLEGAAEKLE